MEFYTMMAMLLLLALTVILIMRPAPNYKPTYPADTPYFVTFYLADTNGNRVATSTAPAKFTLIHRTFYLDEQEVWFDIEEDTYIGGWGIVGWDVDGTTDLTWVRKGEAVITSLKLTAVACEGQLLK